MTPKNFTINEDFSPVSPGEWRQAVEKELAGASFEKKLVSQLYDGISLQPIYTGADAPSQALSDEIPGTLPFVRGFSGLKQRWELHVGNHHPDPIQANRELLNDLQRGAEGLTLRLDQAARAGLEAGGEACGRDGVMIESRDELALALEGIQADIAPVSISPGAAFLPSAALLAALWRGRGVEQSARGSLGADPLGALAAEGTVSGGSIETALEQLGALAAWTDRHLPRMSAAVVSTSPYYDAGATAVQDLAIAIATGVAYLRALTRTGLSADAAFRQIAFSFSIGTHFFQEIARLRAARRLWARVIEACGGSEAAGAMRIGAVHAATAQRVLTQRDPWVNILRGTASCFAAGIGGADSICVEPYDARLGLPDEPSRRLARNTQIILQEESHLARVMDPAGGSWFIESLTDDFAAKAWELFQEIEAQGGMAPALTSGWIAARIDAIWTERAKNLARRKDPVTGVSEFPNLREKLPEHAAPELAQLRKAQAQRRAQRNAEAAGAACARVAVAKPEEKIEALIAAAASGATIAGLCEALASPIRKIMEPLPVRPLAGLFEALRDASDAYLQSAGARPRVFLANLGPLAHYTARATWTQNFFEAGGFEVIGGPGAADGAAAAAAWKASAANVAVICSSDKIYAEQVPPVATALKAAGARTVVLAGHPGDNREAWRGAGIDFFIHVGCDVHATLSAILKLEGAL